MTIPGVRMVRMGVMLLDGNWHAFVENDEQLVVTREPYESRDEAMVVAKMEAERIRMDLERRGVPHRRVETIKTDLL